MRVALFAGALLLACSGTIGSIPPPQVACDRPAAKLLRSLGQDGLLIGAQMADATAASAPFTLRYRYLSGGLPDDAATCQASCGGSCTAQAQTCSSQQSCAWWGCWGGDAPGKFARNSLKTDATRNPEQLTLFTFYELLQTSGAEEGAPEVEAVNGVALMRGYFDDWRFLLQQIGTHPALLHLEPDFWGEAEKLNENPHAISAAVASANPTDCADQENSVAGFGRCLIAMVRRYAPNAKVGLHASSWATGIDVTRNSDASLKVDVEARKLATFLSECGEKDADFVVVEASDRDAGYEQSLGVSTWWDASNTKLPDFQQAFSWAGAVSRALGLPLLWWQLPVGNANLSDVPGAWKDNRVDYFFDHLDQVVSSGAFAIAFGAGASDQTSPETDGGHLVSRLEAAVEKGPVAVCPMRSTAPRP